MRILDIAPINFNSRRYRRYHDDVLVTRQAVELSLKDLLSEDTAFLEVKVSGELNLVTKTTPLSQQTLIPMEELPETLVIQANTYSEKIEDRTLDFYLFDESERIIGIYYLSFTVLQVCLDVDADRDGVVEENNPHKADWQPGKEGYGAILLANSDRDYYYANEDVDFEDRHLSSPLDLKDCSLMVVRRIGPRRLPSDCDLVVWVDDQTSRYLRIFTELDSSGYELLGPGRSEGRLNPRDLNQDLFLAAEGIHYPDPDFDGAIFLNLSLVKNRETIYTDTVRLQVSPWLMIPCTQSAQTVYILRTASGSNAELIEAVRQVAGEAKAQMEVILPDRYQGDRWMQDEIEIGYSESPGHFMYVVLDSPRDRGLDEFPEQELLGNDIGFIKILHRDATTLDSFGNLEVSPPVTANGVHYPLGRILFGGDHPDVPEYSSRMVKIIRDFLYAQVIQSPIELFSDWLDVGHIDEFLSFVPTPTPLGFKLLLASPNKTYTILDSLADQGQGDLSLRTSQGRISISDLLSDSELRADNHRFQDYINLNRQILTKELGLTSEDILDLPALFLPVGKKRRAETYFPNVVNMLVLDQHLAIPKPFGPVIDGECQIEVDVKKTLEPFGLHCHFIDDWEPYFLGRGEIHCGSNARRKPLTTKWWEVSL